MSTVDSFLSTLHTLQLATESVFGNIDVDDVEQHAASITELAEKIEKEFDEQESNLDEDDDAAVTRLEALENAKDTLKELAEKIEEVHTFLESISDNYEEIQQALNEAKP